MRDLKRNQQTVFYALLNVSAAKDEWGNANDVKSYGTPQEIRMSVSANRGEASAQAYGADLRYDREMMTHDMDCPIDEYTHLWLDGRKTTETHNYEVAAVSKSMNCIRYAIRRVNVS
jgi:hypothetical protein